MNTDWMINEHPPTLGFREIGAEGATTQQMRKEYKFARHMLIHLTADITADEGELGDTSNGIELYGYQGDYKVFAIAILGGNRKWICTRDALVGMEQGLNVIRREQVWEMADPYEDLDWPT